MPILFFFCTDRLTQRQLRMTWSRTIPTFASTSSSPTRTAATSKIRSFQPFPRVTRSTPSFSFAHLIISRRAGATWPEWDRFWSMYQFALRKQMTEQKQSYGEALRTAPLQAWRSALLRPLADALERRGNATSAVLLRNLLRAIPPVLPEVYLAHAMLVDHARPLSSPRASFTRAGRVRRSDAAAHLQLIGSRRPHARNARFLLLSCPPLLYLSLEWRDLFTGLVMMMVMVVGRISIPFITQKRFCVMRARGMQMRSGAVHMRRKTKRMKMPITNSIRDSCCSLSSCGVRGPAGDEEDHQQLKLKRKG